MTRLCPVVAIALVGCSGAGTGGSNRHRGDPRSDAEDALILAVGKRDPVAVERLLRAPVELGGLWFPDADCQTQFGAPMRVERAQIEALAKCLVELPLLRSNRKHTLYSTAIVHYEPGIELEVQFRLTGHPTVARIGFAGRRGKPTITAALLESARLDGDPIATLSPETSAALKTELKAAGREYAYAWVEVCVDETGAVSGVHPREATSARAHAAFAEVIRAWKFKPLSVGGTPTPACAQLRFVHPADATVTSEVLPVPYPADEAVRVPLATLRRLAGSDSIPPDDSARRELEDIGGGTVVGAFQFCIDPTGAVRKVEPLQSTGLPTYDRKLVTALSTWKFEPFVVDAKPVEACAGVVFVYQQPQS